MSNQNFINFATTPGGVRWTTTKTAGLANGVKMLVYGGAGSGKTRLCRTLPRPMILSAESGLLSLRGHDILAALISQIQDLYSVYTWLTRSAEARLIDSVCLDSVTEIAEVVLSNAKSISKDPRQAYGVLLEQMIVAVKAFRDLPEKHVYISAKMEFQKDEATGAMKYGPMMPGAKLGSQLPYLFDEVFFLGSMKGPDGKDYEYLQTTADFQHVAKDRSGALDKLEPPDLGHVLNKIYKGV